jgi:hypothetical protein
MTDETRALIEAEKNAPPMAVYPVAEKPVQGEPIQPNELIDTAINTAIIQRIKTDEKVQENFFKTADTVIENKLETAQSNAEGEAKEAHLKNNQDACDLYGIDEKTVPKWVVNVAKIVQDFWYAFWLIVGFFTTAPIVFLSKKIMVVFKKTWIAVALAIVVYLAIVLTTIIVALTKNI